MGVVKNEILTKKKYWISILVVLIIAFSLSTVYAYHNITTSNFQKEKEKVVLYQYKAWYDHDAIVERPNPLWSVGTSLNNQPLYFSAITPNLSVKFHFLIDSPSPKNITVNYQLKKVLLCGGKERNYWSKEEVITTGEEKLRSGGLQSDFRLNITEVERDIKGMREALDFYGGDIKLNVIAKVSYQGEIGKEKVKEEKEFPLTINLKGAYYEVSGKTFKEPVEREIVRKRAIPLSPSEKTVLVAPPVILFLSIICFVGIKQRYRPLTEEEVKKLKRDKEYRRFKEEISEGKYHEELERGKKLIEIKSLEDLIKAAIDMYKRVIYDPEREIYFVIDGDYLYLYRGRDDGGTPLPQSAVSK